VNRKVPAIAAWSLSAIIALMVAARLWSTAFPVAAIASPLTAVEARGRLTDFIHSMGVNTDGYRDALRFGEDTNARNYIERQYGSARLSQVVASGISVWSWQSRWFKPEVREEFRAQCNQRGYISGYTHIIESDAALPSLDEGAARKIAETFLRTSIPSHPFDQLTFLEARTMNQTHRTDYTFVWEQPSLRLDDASYQLTVSIQGNEIGSYSEWLKIPGWWQQQYGQDRAVSVVCYRIAVFASTALVLGLLVTFLIGIAHHQVRWTGAIGWGWLILVALVGLFDAINSFPTVLFNYSTAQQWEPFITGNLFVAGQSILGDVVLVWVLILICDIIYRREMPAQLPFRYALSIRALRDRGSVRAMGVGIALAAFGVAYVCIFYSISQRIGVWCPVETDFGQTLSGPFPWITAIKTGLSAAFMEEMLFRVGALLLLLRLVKNRWVAVVLSAAAWAFLHSNYPQIPGYTRGIELTIVGIVWGFVLLRYGIVAPLIAHYLYDCGLGVVAVYQGESLPGRIASIAVLVWPLALFALGLFLAKSDGLPEPEIEGFKRTVALPSSVSWQWTPVVATSSRYIWVLMGSIAAIVLVMWLPQPQAKVMALGKLDLSRAQILQRADEALVQRGYSTQGWERVASVEARAIPSLYLLEHGTLDQFADLYHVYFPDIYWRVTYFKFLQPERFSVLLDPSGDFISWSHAMLPETAGASLEPADALAAANAALKAQHVDVSKEELFRHEPMQQEHRRDWIFGFEQKDFHLGDARLWTYVRIQGNEAMDFTRVFKLPDSWIDAHRNRGWWALISSGVQRGLQTITAAALAIFFGLALRRWLIPWKEALLWALAPTAMSIAAELNRLPVFYSGYSATVSKGQYIAAQLSSDAQALAWSYVGSVFAFALAFGLLRWAWGWTPNQWRSWRGQSIQRRLYWRDTWLIIFASIAGFWLLNLCRDELLGFFWPASAANIQYWNVEEWMPWFGALNDAVQQGFSHLTWLAVIAGAYRLIARRNAWAGYFVLFVFVPLQFTGWPDTAGEFLLSFCYAEAKVALTAWFVRKLWRFNAPCIFLTYAMLSLVDSILIFVKKGGPYYQLQAAPLIELIIVILALALFCPAKQSDDFNLVRDT
jgi:membrane protease YdiL (CAAX protease family)